MANTSSAQESLQGCTMHVIKFYIFFIIIIFIHLSFIRSFTLKKVSLVSSTLTSTCSWWGAIHDLYGESTNETCGRVWIALYRYVKKKDLPLHMKIWLVFFSSSFDRFSRPFLFCYTFMGQLYMYFDRKVNWTGLLLQ